MPFRLRRRPKTAAAARPNSTIIGGAGTSWPPDVLLLDEVDDEELLEVELEDEVLLLEEPLLLEDPVEVPVDVPVEDELDDEDELDEDEDDDELLVLLVMSPELPP